MRAGFDSRLREEEDRGALPEELAALLEALLRTRKWTHADGQRHC